MNKFNLLIISALLASGCATQSQLAKTEGTTIGAVLGGAVGCGLGFLIGGRAEDCVIGAIAGGVAGGIGGYAWANNIDQHHQELLSKEGDVNGQIAVAQQMNTEMVQSNKDLESKLVSYDQEISSLQKKAAYDASAEKELLATKESIEKDRAVMQKALASTKSTLNDMERLRTANNSPSPELDAEINRLKTNYSALERKSTEFATQSNRI